MAWVTYSIAESLSKALSPEYMEREIAIPAMKEAMEVIAQAARENLASHQSHITGTAMGWSNKAKERAARRRPMIESIKTRAFIADGEVTGVIFVDADAAHIGRFMEYGTDDKRVWGHYTGGVRAPIPFLRPAYENKRWEAMAKLQRGIDQRFKRLAPRQAA